MTGPFRQMLPFGRSYMKLTVFIEGYPDIMMGASPEIEARIAEHDAGQSAASTLKVDITYDSGASGSANVYTNKHQLTDREIDLIIDTIDDVLEEGIQQANSIEEVNRPHTEARSYIVSCE